VANRASGRIVNAMDDDHDNPYAGDPFGPFGADRAPTSRFGGEPLTLALLEDLAALLQRHGYPPLRGYALAELTASLYRLQYPHG
jgi:hypothetical protein